MATIKERIDLLDTMHGRERDIMLRKAHDYSGDIDCNHNIRACETVGIATAETGVLIRILDKMSRIANLIKPNHTAAVVDESVDDTIADARNYLAILQHLLVEKREKTRAVATTGSPSSDTGRSS